MDTVRYLASYFSIQSLYILSTQRMNVFRLSLRITHYLHKHTYSKAIHASNNKLMDPKNSSLQQLKLEAHKSTLHPYSFFFFQIIFNIILQSMLPPLMATSKFPTTILYYQSSGSTHATCSAQLISLIGNTLITTSVHMEATDVFTNIIRFT